MAQAVSCGCARSHACTACAEARRLPEKAGPWRASAGQLRSGGVRGLTMTHTRRAHKRQGTWKLLEPSRTHVLRSLRKGLLNSLLSLFVVLLEMPRVHKQSTCIIQQG